MHRFTTLLLAAAVHPLLAQADDASPAETLNRYIAVLPASQKSSPQPKLAEEPRSHLQIGGNYRWAHISPNGLPSTSGNLGGAQALYEYKAPRTVYGALALTWSEGNTENGNDRSLSYVDIQERLGYTFGTWHDWFTFTLFTGFGYRHYGENVSSSGNNIIFNYNEFYFPVGFLTSSKVNSYFTIGLNFQWMPQVYPTVKITPLNGARWILTNEMPNFRVEMPFTFTVSDKYHCFIVLEPFFEYWQDGKTTATTELGISLDIPRNKYLFAGANLNIGVSF